MGGVVEGAPAEPAGDARVRVQAVEDVLNVGDKLRVKIANVDDRGKIDLIRPELEGKIAPREARPPRSGGGDRGGRPPRRD